MKEEDEMRAEIRTQDKELNALLKQQEKPAILRGGKKQYPFLLVWLVV